MIRVEENVTRTIVYDNDSVVLSKNGSSLNSGTFDSENTDKGYEKLLKENEKLKKELKDYIKYKDTLEQVIESDRTLIQVYENNIKYFKDTLDLYREKLKNSKGCKDREGQPQV